ncbi:N-acetylglutamate synthase-like GNAT family acetyltransferase [Halarchaeum rubridurum]|uniref:N-acetylglutamate synthase-like GNAT family acetyltransferase n=1 Tax=Halarchaeum rubridurum TaxID=489911 RepID=A0A830G316_9EURY|nr:hypothetical protein [Halarchaeum rubridurum]MBP1955571.1 N-acetylglutamate synthase-like GNAT family acetyltransferase [Halarchaeum rubridurum]GGM73449.1 hypothetical protein GCM10009017_24200 [Halarchaeum rubridurum]
MDGSEVQEDVYEALLTVSEDDDWGLRDLAAHADVTEDGFGMQLCERCLNRLEAQGRVEWTEGTWQPAEY